MVSKSKRPGGSRGVFLFCREQRPEQHSSSTRKTEMIRGLVDLGWSIFPIASHSKIPLAKWASGVAFEDRDFEQRFESLLAAKAKKLRDKGMTLPSKSPLAHLDLFRASNDEVMIDHWLARWPMAGFAVACEPSDLFVLDVDRHGDVDGADTLSLLQQRFGKLPISPIQRTGGGGFQIFFAKPAGIALRNSCNKLGTGLDTRGDGGMAIVPPSIHPSGKAYHWITGREPWVIPPAVPSSWLVKLLQLPVEPSRSRPSVAPIGEASRTRYAERALMEELASLREAEPGERNHILNRVSFVLGQLAADGLLAPDATLSLIAGAARTIGLQDHEITRTMRSGWESGLAQPREIQP